jgi:1,6-anhydro-N-acetylmuramate kinase
MTESMDAQPSSDSPTAEIRADIEQTRAELAQTVDALTDKLDVKARASDKVADAKAKVADAAAQAKQKALEQVGAKAGPVVHSATEQVRPYRKQIVLGALAGVVALLIVRKRRG